MAKRTATADRNDSGRNLLSLAQNRLRCDNNGMVGSGRDNDKRGLAVAGRYRDRCVG